MTDGRDHLVCGTGFSVVGCGTRVACGRHDAGGSGRWLLLPEGNAIEQLFELCAVARGVHICSHFQAAFFSRFLKIFVSFSSSVAAVKGFTMYPFAPACAASMMFSLRASAVIMSTGRCLRFSSARMFFSSSIPVMFGMFQSDTTKSNLFALSMFSATTPSSASSAFVYPSSFSRFRTMRRMVEKSSTTRNFIVGSLIELSPEIGLEVRPSRG